MTPRKMQVNGTLLGLPIKGQEAVLDGFWRHELDLNTTLLVYVHGMHSNFYRSKLKKELMRHCVGQGYDLLSFNTRGAEGAVAYERFTDCLADIETVLNFGASRGYKRFALIGHSTGCQKITYYQAMRQDKRVCALIDLAPGDDYAIWRRDIGKRADYWLKKAHALVRERKGDTLLPAECLGFTAKRFLSVADPTKLESKIFNYAGPLTHFSRVTAPTLVLFGSEEEYACIPVEKMGDILKNKSSSAHFTFHTIPGADHGFHGQEKQTARYMYTWLKSVCEKRG
ncbi:MAG: alpha/beta fold hydrolase [Spartobacteria bacterium]|nr:alpha/beta fold hydrolase [Spartobacteria bacterium]